jgi:hypothetical protein
MRTLFEMLDADEDYEQALARSASERVQAEWERAVDAAWARLRDLGLIRRREVHV